MNEPNMKEQETLRAFFSDCAKDYEEKIIPAFEVFAQAVIQFAGPRSDDRVLDIGTGTGILARLVAPHVASVIGIDFSIDMIEEAIRTSPSDNLSKLDFVVADAEQMSFDDHRFSLVASSFGLNALATPKVFDEAYRVLASGGRFIFQEWAAEYSHPFDQEIGRVVALYRDESSTNITVLKTREAMVLMNRWSAMFPSAEHYQESLIKSGFENVQFECDRSVKCVLPVDRFLTYKMTWSHNAVELGQLPDAQRTECIEEMRKRLSLQANSQGELEYDPLLVRVCATK